jgi:catechol 2,3-dioxygenase-like lactoylglutathione lyase family enzyme
MGLHRLTHVTLATRDAAATADFYETFGLRRTDESRFETVDGGEQLRLVEDGARRVVELGLGVATVDDLNELADRLCRHDRPADLQDGTLRSHESGAGFDVVVTVAPPITSTPRPAAHLNRPGSVARTDRRADGIDREEPVRPRKLGHVVIGSTEPERTQRFFTEGLGFAVSDEIPGVAAFLRCSTDHHNVLVQGGPVTYVHHTSWQVDDVDEIGRGAKRILDGDPDRHVWGLGRHYLGSNFFWYLRDPGGTFAEYYADLDIITDPAAWEPRAMTDERALYSWGPPPPMEFLAPTDLEVTA